MKTYREQLAYIKAQHGEYVMAAVEVVVTGVVLSAAIQDPMLQGFTMKYASTVAGKILVLGGVKAPANFNQYALDVYDAMATDALGPQYQELLDEHLEAKLAAGTPAVDEMVAAAIARHKKNPGELN